MTFSVERGVPFVPRGSSGSYSTGKYPFALMDVGDSFVVPATTPRSMIAVAMRRAHGALGYVFVSRSVNAGVRVWRIA